MATDPLTPDPRQVLSRRFTNILDDRWPLAGQLLLAVDDYETAVWAGAEAELLALRPVVEAAKRVIQGGPAHRDGDYFADLWEALTTYQRALSGQAVTPTPNPLSPLVHALSPEAHPLHGGFAPSRFCETCNAGDAAKADRDQTPVRQHEPLCDGSDHDGPCEATND